MEATLPELEDQPPTQSDAEEKTLQAITPDISTNMVSQPPIDFQLRCADSAVADPPVDGGRSKLRAHRKATEWLKGFTAELRRK